MKKRKRAGAKRRARRSPRTAPASLRLMSPALENGRPIPPRYTAEGTDVSPPLAWSEVPAGCRSLAVLCEHNDGDAAHPQTHWLIYNVRPRAGGLPEGIARAPVPGGMSGAAQGRNDFGEVGYAGPAPPREPAAHGYCFRVYALDGRLDLAPGATRRELERAMAGRVLAVGQIEGTCRSSRVEDP